MVLVLFLVFYISNKIHLDVFLKTGGLIFLEFTVQQMFELLYRLCRVLSPLLHNFSLKWELWDLLFHHFHIRNIPWNGCLSLLVWSWMGHCLITKEEFVMHLNMIVQKKKKKGRGTNKRNCLCSQVTICLLLKKCRALTLYMCEKGFILMPLGTHKHTKHLSYK